MWIYLVILSIVVIVAILLTVYVIFYNKFQVAIIRISEAEENISMLLEKKLDLMIRIQKFILEKKEDSKINGIEKLEKQELNSFELNSELDKYYKKIVELTDFSKDIIFDDNEQFVLKELNSVHIECLAAEKYYNDYVVVYNQLVKCFPSNIVARFSRYGIKEFYSNEKEEIFEILKK